MIGSSCACTSSFSSITVRMVSSVFKTPMAVIAFSSPSSEDVKIWKIGQTRRGKILD